MNISFISVHSSILLEHYSETGVPHEQDPHLDLEILFLLFPFRDLNWDYLFCVMWV